jgi:hypothetical protein
MENSFQTSFIPKKPITTSRPVRTSRFNLFSFFSILALIIIGALAGGLFFYQAYLTNQESILSSSLKKVSASFDQNTISQLELYNKRATVAKTLLDSHVVLSPLFSTIGALTIPTVQYTQFDQTTDPTGFSVKMSGIASDYKSIALQADSFNGASGHPFQNVVFSNLKKDTSGGVTFDVQFTVDPSLLSYEKNITAENAVTPSSTTPSSPSPVTAAPLQTINPPDTSSTTSATTPSSTTSSNVTTNTQ